MREKGDRLIVCNGCFMEFLDDFTVFIDRLFYKVQFFTDFIRFKFPAMRYSNALLFAGFALADGKAQRIVANHPNTCELSSCG